jgi:hypothetical protein
VKTKFRLAFICCFLILFSCGNPVSRLNKEQLLSFIANPKNALCQQQEIRGFKVQVCYEPSSLIAIREYEANSHKDSLIYDRLMKKYAYYYYFILKFSKNGKEAIRQLSGFDQYSDMVQKFSFGMSEFINITVPPGDTILLSDYIFEQSFGMSDANTLLVSFQKERLKHADEINFNLFECGLGIGNTRFKFTGAAIDKVPLLEYFSLQ